MSQGSEYTYLSTAAFEKEILQCNKPVIVEFGTEWCGSCRIMTSIVSNISTTYQEQICVVKLDFDRNQHLVTEYGIQAKPTFLFIKEGEVVDQILGSAPRKDFDDKLISLLSIE